MPWLLVLPAPCNRNGPGLNDPHKTRPVFVKFPAIVPRAAKRPLFQFLTDERLYFGYQRSYRRK